MSSSEGPSDPKAPSVNENKTPKKQMGVIYSAPCKLVDKRVNSNVQDWKVWRPVDDDQFYRLTWHDAKTRQEYFSNPYPTLTQADWELKAGVVREAQISRYCKINFNFDTSDLSTINEEGRLDLAEQYKTEAGRFFPTFTFVGQPASTEYGCLVPFENLGGPVQQQKAFSTEDDAEVFFGNRPFYEYGSNHPFTFNTRAHSLKRWKDTVFKTKRQKSAADAESYSPNLNTLVPVEFYPGPDSQSANKSAWMTRMRMAMRKPSIYVVPPQEWRWDQTLDMNVPVLFKASPAAPRPTEEELAKVETQIRYAITNDIFRKAYKMRNFPS